jgi:hypothetical protein
MRALEYSSLPTGTENYYSLVSGELFHSPLRRIYKYLSLEFPTIPEHVLLALSVKAMNDICGSERLLPSFLVFVVLPRLPVITSAIPHQWERMKALHIAGEEYESFVCKRRVQTGLRKQPPSAANYILRTRDRVYVYLEQLSLWTGPHVGTSADGSDISSDPGEHTGPRHFNCAKVKPAFLSPEPHKSQPKMYPKNLRYYLKRSLNMGIPELRCLTKQNVTKLWD